LSYDLFEFYKSGQRDTATEQKFGLDLKRYAKRNNVDYQSLLEQEAQRNLYTYDYVFNI